MSRLDPVIFYKSILPTCEGEFVDQLNSCFQSIASLATDENAIVFKLVIFNDLLNENDLISRDNFVKTLLNKYFPEKCPTYALINQLPEAPHKVSCETAFLRKGSGKILYRNAGDLPYVILDFPGFRELWASGIRSVKDYQTIEESAKQSFDRMHQLLESEGMNFNHIVRQWNYVGGILEQNQLCTTCVQNYQLFNEIRHIYYKRFRTMKGFPAATGIGNNTQNITLEICAIQADDTLIDVAIENPKQLNPYQYGQEVLAGDPIPSQEVKHPPEFERAKLVITPYISRVFISGTASITGQLTIGIGDIEKQTKCTLENIGLLIADETLRKSYPGIPSGKLNFSFLRIYVKYARDVEKVREICEQYYPSVIKTYTVTDVCRDDLLVEIEGELFLDPRKADN